MDPKYISTFIFGAGVILGIFQAFVLLGIPKGNRRANRILALLVLTFSINIAHAVLSSDIFSSGKHFTGVNEPFQFLLGPLVFLYVRELTSQPKHIKGRDMLHFIPFSIYAVLIMLKIVFPGMKLYNNEGYYITVGVWFLILLHVSIYTIYSANLVKQHWARIKDCYSDIDRINLRWLKYFIHILHFIYIIYFLLLIWLLHRSTFGNPSPHFQMIISLVLSLTLFFLGYRGMVQPQLFSYEDKPDTDQPLQSHEEISIPAEAAPKYERSGLNEQKSNDISEKLKEFMEKEKPYLNPELTLPDLSEQLGIPRNNLSQVLNDGIGVNFYDFVNGYRIKEVQSMMTTPKYRNYKLLALAFDAGFNSKATFNSIFKKMVGMTPSEYRKSIKSDEDE